MPSFEIWRNTFVILPLISDDFFPSESTNIIKGGFISRPNKL